jgi:predicted dehydrogenase
VKFKRILFVGLGGAGQRHLRIFRKLLPLNTVFSAYRHTGATPFLKADFSVDHKQSVETTYDLHVFDAIEDAFAAKPDLTVISTPTSCHREPMMLAVEAGSGVFVEKPWAEDLEGFPEFRDKLLAKQLSFHVSFQRRFHPQIAQMHRSFSLGEIGRPLAATFNVFSNVPDWHPYEDWHNLYAVRAELGGGVLLTEIHELDLANWFFGLPDFVFCAGGNRGNDRLPVEDTVQMTLIYANFSAQITLCFMHAKPSRSIHISGTKGDIKWDSNANRLLISQFNGSVEDRLDLTSTNDEMFFLQAESFLFNWSSVDTLTSLASAADSLAIVDAARRSMLSRTAEPIRSIPIK